MSLTPNVMKALDDCFVYGRTFDSDAYADDVAAFEKEIARRDAAKKNCCTDMNQ